MSKWIAEFDLEDGDKMPEHMDLNYMGAKIDFHCRPMWILVSERLPKKNQICIVTDETRCNAYEYTFCDETYDEEQGWTYLSHRIIAWMPLPEPYTERREE